MSPSSQRTLVRGGTLIDPSQNLNSQGSLVLCAGKIEAILREDESPSGNFDEIIDAQGLWVTPGFIDAHVHLREPGLEHKETIETGTRAAAAGGFTSVACMANTQPVNDNEQVTRWIINEAQKSGNCRVLPIGSVSKNLEGKELSDMGLLAQAGAVAFSDDGHPVMNSGLMRMAMEYAQGLGLPVISHAEDWSLVSNGAMNEGETSRRMGLKGNPSASEEIMVAREIALCRLTGCRVHIGHVSTLQAVKQIRQAKLEGLPITAEVTPHHLFLNDTMISNSPKLDNLAEKMRQGRQHLPYNTHCKMAPPLRSAADVQALRAGLAEGVIDMIATDHAPHASVDKNEPFEMAANGILGVQTAVSLCITLVHEGLLSRERFIESMTSKPAQLLGLKTGRFEAGTPADITILDPSEEWTFQGPENASKSSNSPFFDWRFRGRAVRTIVGGTSTYILKDKKPFFTKDHSL